jgi:peptidoglycan L-alanyl-D-glutamate endopeptidase CwlK
MAEHDSWGAGSKSKIMTLADPWPAMLDDILAACPFDLAVVWGFRGRLAQERAVADNTTTKEWPHSLHNSDPSIAVDLAPYINGTIDWGDHDHGRRFYILAGIVFAVAEARGNVEIRWGGDWDQDGDLDDQTLIDLGHFEARIKEEV